MTGLSLLDAMQLEARCTNLSDLRYLRSWAWARLARALEKIQPDAATLFEWNDVLQYLTQELPQPTQEAAKDRLIGALKNR